MFLDNNVSLDFRILLFITFWITFTLECLGTDHYKSDGGGGGGIFSLHNFFFRSMHEFFFQVNPSARIFFSDKYCFFFSSEILIHYLCFCALYIILHSQQIKGYSPL